jgi:hypothetical protein
MLFTPPHRLTVALLALVAFLAVPLSASAAQPVDRWEKWLEGERFEDVVEQSRKWLDRNADDELAPEVLRILAEAEYRLLQSAPTVPKVAAWREEFPDSPRMPDALELESKLALYAASDKATEAAYRDIVDGYPGTDASTEAHARAEEAGFTEAVADGSAEAMARFLGRYPQSGNAATAKRLWRTRAWDEAEAADTLQSWIDLRAADPDHPRADEAYMREQALALQDLPPNASTDALLKLARRYEKTPTGWETLHRAVGRSTWRISTAQGAEVSSGVLDEMSADAAPLPGVLVEAISIDLVGPRPKSAEITFALEVKVGREWFDWNVKASEQAQAWNKELEPPAERVGPAVHWLTSAAPCILPGVEAARVRVHLQQEAKKADWELPVTIDKPCGGLLPLAVRYGAAGVVDAMASLPDFSSEPTLKDLQVLAAGLAWSCSGTIQVDETGLWLTCSGWQVGIWGRSLLFRPPPLGAPSATGDPDHPGLATLPIEAGERWLALDVPGTWHFGGEPRCPLPEVRPAAELSDPVEDEAPMLGPPDLPPPPVPLWVHPGLAKTADYEGDFDGDGTADRMILLTPRGDNPAWLVLALGSFPAELSWTMPWYSPAPGAKSRVQRSGCGYAILPPE